jgi:hypothetical protein
MSRHAESLNSCDQWPRGRDFLMYVHVRVFLISQDQIQFCYQLTRSYNTEIKTSHTLWECCCLFLSFDLGNHLENCLTFPKFTIFLALNLLEIINN